MDFGPAPINHERRMTIALEIVDKLRAHFGERVIALGLIGSLATGKDGPYSDIEMECVLEGSNINSSLEWTTGDWKAEVSISSVNVILSQAGRVAGNWAMTHGCYLHALPIYDPTNLFLHLRKTAVSQPAGRYRQAMRELIIGDIYELVGKIRNARVQGIDGIMAQYTVKLAEFGAWLIGLSNRTLFSTRARMLQEALALDGRPEGFDALANAVQTGKLGDAGGCAALCEDFWSGVIEWTKTKNLRLVEALDDLLARFKEGE